MEIVRFRGRTALTRELEFVGIRIGVHTGPVIAGGGGIDKFAFDVWGETVNYRFAHGELRARRPY